MKETRRDFLKKTGGCALGMVSLATQMQSPRHHERNGSEGDRQRREGGGNYKALVLFVLVGRQ